MNSTTRRDHLKMLFGMAAMSGTPLAALAQSAAKPAEPVPPQGIGQGITHLSYSDQGGRPDGVQVMVNRKHVYVGHMFSDGLTILDATDPRNLKPVGFFTAGPGHAHAPAANGGRHAAARQWREHRRDAVLRRHARLFREQPGRQHHQPEEIPLRPVDPRYFQARAR